MKKILTIVIMVVALQLGVASVALASGGTYHKVMYGETLYGIARYYGSNPYAIAEVNGLYDPDYIYAGQVLYIPAGYGGCNPCDSGWNQRPVKWQQNQCNPCVQPPRYQPCNPCDQQQHYGWQNNQYQQGWQNMGYNQGGYDKYNKHGGNYGYDYTGYYYSYGNQKYSHSCGYNANCW